MLDYQQLLDQFKLTLKLYDNIDNKNIISEIDKNNSIIVNYTHDVYLNYVLYFKSKYYVLYDLEDLKYNNTVIPFDIFYNFEIDSPGFVMANGYYIDDITNIKSDNLLILDGFNKIYIVFEYKKNLKVKFTGGWLKKKISIIKYLNNVKYNNNSYYNSFKLQSNYYFFQGEIILYSKSEFLFDSTIFNLIYDLEYNNIQFYYNGTTINDKLQQYTSTLNYELYIESSDLIICKFKNKRLTSDIILEILDIRNIDNLILYLKKKKFLE
jgi:hypothetical protein